MSNGRIDPADRLEALVREDYERSHPSDTFEDLKRRSKFTKEDKGLLRDWMALAAMRAEKQGAAQRDAA